MKYKIGQIVRVGGSKGPIETIVGYKDNCYIVSSENCTGYITEDLLRPYKAYKQLSLFEGNSDDE